MKVPEHGSAKSQASEDLLPGEVSLPRVSKGEVSSGHGSRPEMSRKHYGGLTGQ